MPATQQFAPTFSSAIADAHNYMDWIIGTCAPIPGLTCSSRNRPWQLLRISRQARPLSRYRHRSGERRQSRARDIRRAASSLQTSPRGFRSGLPPGSVDTVVCCNVIEHIEDDNRAGLQHGQRAWARRSSADPGAGAAQLYGDLDRLAGHHRRYNKPLMLKACAGAPIEILELRYFNPIGGLAWWVNTFAKTRFAGCFRGQRTDPDLRQIRVADFQAGRSVDARFFGQSLICIARRA